MTILLILALLLAWPTFGLSLLAFVAFVVGRGYLVGRLQKFDADQKRAEREVLNGARRLPSWAGNSDEMDVFQQLLLKMTTRRGVSPSFVRALFADKGTFDRLLFLAGAMENLGASFNRQNVAVTDKIVEMWNRAPVDLKTSCIFRDQQAAQATQATQSATPRAKASRTKPPRSTAPDRARARGHRVGRALRKAGQVAYRVWRVVAVAAVLATMIAAVYVSATVDVVDGALLLILAAVIAIGGSGAVYLALFARSGSYRDYDAFVWKAVFGDLSVYAWCILGVLYLGGAGNALWHAPSDPASFGWNFVVGTGAAAVLLILGYPGRLLVSPGHRTPGHILGTAVAALIVATVFLGGVSVEQVLELATSQL